MNFMMSLALQIKKPYLAIGLIPLCRECLNRNHGNRLTFLRASDSKHYLARNFCVQGVILAHANIVSGMKLGTPLADDNATWIDEFSTIGFHAKPF